MKSLSFFDQKNKSPFAAYKDPESAFAYSDDNRLLLREMLGLNGRFTICCFSDMKTVSDVELPLLLMRYLKKTHPDAVLLIMGEGEMLSTVAATIEYDDLSDFVHPLGSTNNPGGILSASDALLIAKSRDLDRAAEDAALINGITVLNPDPEKTLEENAKAIEKEILSLSVRT